MNGGSLDTAHVSTSEHIGRIHLIPPSITCKSGQLPLEVSSRLLKTRYPCLRYRDSGDACTAERT